MIPDQGKHFIISHGYGSFEAYPCTLDNARALLAQREELLQVEVREVLALTPQSHHVVSAERVVKALQSVVSDKEGNESRDLQRLLYGNGPRKGEEDLRPKAVVTSELKAELALWCLKEGINPHTLSKLNADFLNRNRGMLPSGLFSALEARAQGRILRFVDDWVLSISEEYTQLKTGTWKEGAPEHRIVSQFLEFINANLTSREEKFDIASLKPTP